MVSVPHLNDCCRVLDCMYAAMVVPSLLRELTRMAVSNVLDLWPASFYVKCDVLAQTVVLLVIIKCRFVLRRIWHLVPIRVYAYDLTALVRSPYDSREDKVHRYIVWHDD